MSRDIGTLVSIVYRVWPPFIRLAEKLGFHDFRQHFLLGTINPNRGGENLLRHLTGLGFEKAIIAWRDPGEIFSVRKRDGERFQYHLRFFEDGEIRGHHEYTPETDPFAHLFEVYFAQKEDAFKIFLGDYLVVAASPELETVARHPLPAASKKIFFGRVKKLFSRWAPGR